MKTRQHKLELTIFLFTFSLILLLIQYYAPYLGDDFTFRFAKHLEGEKVVFSDYFVSGFADFFNSLHAHRYTTYGRLGDVFALYSLNFLPKFGFALINALIITITVALISRSTLKQTTPYSLTIAAATTIAILPNLEANAFWICGACCYFWGACQFLIFSFFYHKIRKEGYSNPLSFTCCIFIGFTCGWQHEALGLALLFGLGLYNAIECFTQKKLCHYQEICIFIAVVVGLLLCISAPGFINRCAGAHNAAEAKRLFKAAIVAFSCIPALVTLILTYTNTNFKRLSNFHNLFTFGGLALVTGAILFANGGGGVATGGVRFYFSLGCILLFLESFREKIFIHQKKLCVLASILVIYWAGSNLLRNIQLTSLLGTLAHTPVRNGVMVIEATTQPPALSDWKLQNALPSEPQLQHRGYTWKGQSFYSVINVLLKDKRELKMFDNLAADQYHARITSTGLCIVRYPEGLTPCQVSPMLITDEKHQIKALAVHVCPKQAAPSFMQSLFYMLSRKVTSICRFSTYFDGVFHYVVLDSTPAANSILKVQTRKLDDIHYRADAKITIPPTQG